MDHSSERAKNLTDPSHVNKMNELSRSLQEHKIIKDYNVDDFDEDYLIYALFCFEEIPLEMIEDVLNESAEEMGEYYYWLADDDYSTLPQSKDGEEHKGTQPPLPSAWRSPFLGSTVDAAFEHVKNAPGELLNRKHIVVLDKKLYEERRLLKIYRIEGPEPDFAEDLGMDIQPGDITEVGGTVKTTMVQLFGYDRGTGSWGDNVSYWKSEGLPFDS